MVTAINLGFPRIGPNRELKRAIEGYWKGSVPLGQLKETAAAIRRQNWHWQQQAGIDHIPSGEFALYDHVLDTACWLDAVPSRYRDRSWNDPLDLSFAMARGVPGNSGVSALEMTKWFDTNYHYLVPEFFSDMQFRLAEPSPLTAYQEARALGITTRPVILGPVSFLLLGKAKEPALRPLQLLDRILPVYEELLQGLSQAASGEPLWVQIDEPVLAWELDDDSRDAISRSLRRLNAAAPGIRIFLAAYFDALGKNLSTALNSPIEALHLDLVRAPQQLDEALQQAPAHLSLSLGLVDGRNIWKTDLDCALTKLEHAATKLGTQRVMVGPSCSLLHVPVGLSTENHLPPELKDWLAFGLQKLDEIALLKKAVNEGRKSVQEAMVANRESLRRRRVSPLVTHPEVRRKVSALSDADFRRQSAFSIRESAQQDHLKLPLFPTTTIGSFPQTAELRKQRAARRTGRISDAEYQTYLRSEIEKTVARQEELGLDVLVHGEPERNDMVEYFGELLDGFLFTSNGWVQSYGTRCVKPPIIYGDVQRKEPMTVEWWRYAQSLTKRPMKGMLTGPVTILQWSFVRDDQPRRDTCYQIALAIREETQDLETAGCKVIQIDEPAIREGLPLHKEAATQYLEWTVAAFRLASSGVRDVTQIHTHMCYAEFNEIVDSIAAMDADVISIESARSQMEALEAFTADRYHNQIGPGMFDIHSPRVPSTGEMQALAHKALRVIPQTRLWMNPDCGLKTRNWDEVIPALSHLVAAAKALRAEVKG